MKKKIKISIQGASGYTGGELIRLLLNHPLCEIVSVSSNFNSGKKISDIHNDLVGDSDLIFSKEIDKNVDVIYLCSGHGKSSTFLKSTKIDKEVRIIDLSQDFRVDNLFEDRVFEYGLPEINKSNILNSNNIANPGCFATAIQLGVLPLISVNINSKEIHTHAITGSTGAGLKLAQTSHFSWRNNNVSWYKPFTHQHLNEVYKTIEKKYNINFIPIRGNFSRGIFCTSYIKTDLDIDFIYKIYFDYYKDHPFTVVSNEEIHLKQVINTNKCLIHLKKVEGKLLITSIIDNLIKGASGQAIQNMNLMFGLDETTGLKLKSSIF
ncbi:MAG: N-acetyl-gamma-glutamyl-phosphate reductase [Flavobacteriaceae bacterium]|tara:strand:- start:825 stop:1790 length:966 start_codon:yes stop_codon:yes gene_type:complete